MDKTDELIEEIDNFLDFKNSYVVKENEDFNNLGDNAQDILKKYIKFEMLYLSSWKLDKILYEMCNEADGEALEINKKYMKYIRMLDKLAVREPNLGKQLIINGIKNLVFASAILEDDQENILSKAIALKSLL